jgi:hypothetical protein
MFTEKQLETLNHMFNKNLYPDPNLKKEMASKMNINPTVLQVGKKPHSLSYSLLDSGTPPTQRPQRPRLSHPHPAIPSPHHTTRTRKLFL